MTFQYALLPPPSRIPKHSKSIHPDVYVHIYVDGNGDGDSERRTAWVRLPVCRLNGRPFPRRMQSGGHQEQGRAPRNRHSNVAVDVDEYVNVAALIVPS